MFEMRRYSKDSGEDVDYVLALIAFAGLSPNQRILYVSDVCVTYMRAIAVWYFVNGDGIDIASSAS